jgi:hypothetical protein
MSTLDDVIATRTYDVLGAHGAVERQVHVRIGRPTQEPTGEWLCPYQITGLGFDRVFGALGMDAIQALQSVMVVIGGTLAGTTEAEEGRLRLDGFDDLGFPLPPEPPSEAR